MNRSFLLISSFLVSDVSGLLISLKSNERCERIAPFAHQKWANMSDLFRSLRWNEQCERIAHFAHQKWANVWIAHFFEWIAHSLIFDNKRAIRSEIEWANSQPWIIKLQLPSFAQLFSIQVGLKGGASVHTTCKIEVYTARVMLFISCNLFLFHFLNFLLDIYSCKRKQK